VNAITLTAAQYLMSSSPS